MADRGPDWAAWVHRLPALVRGLYDEWELRPDGWLMHGYTALIVPVLTSDDHSAVLKVTFPHEEAQHEHLALARWGGDGAVSLLRADPHRWAMLLVALRQETLRDSGDIEACTVVGELYRRLHVPAHPQLRLLSGAVDASAEALARLPRSTQLPRRLVEQATSLARAFADDPVTDGALVHGDLHYDNVLMNDAGEWLAIDPKPISGDPHYEVAPMLWNRFDELAAPESPLSVRAGVRRRFHALVDTAGLDEGRARDWVIVRVMVNALAALSDRNAGHPPDWLTTCIAIAKAVQD